MPPETNYSNQINNLGAAPAQPGFDAPKKSSAKFLAIILLLVVVIVFISVFAVWAFAQMKDYKNNSDQKSAVAVQKAKAEQEKVLKAQFAETEKEPLKSYTGPSQYGGVKIVYPKTWSAYIVEQTNSSSTPVDGYFYPDFVPGVTPDKKANYALRLQISSASYKSEIDQHKSQIDKGQLKATTFKPALVKDASVGVRLDGQIATDKKGSMIVVPLRDKVLKIWTENDANLSDFNNFILKNLTYSP